MEQICFPIYIKIYTFSKQILGNKKNFKHLLLYNNIFHLCDAQKHYEFEFRKVLICIHNNYSYVELKLVSMTSYKPKVPFDDWGPWGWQLQTYNEVACKLLPTKSQRKLEKMWMYSVKFTCCICSDRAVVHLIDEDTSVTYHSLAKTNWLPFSPNSWLNSWLTKYLFFSNHYEKY